MVFEAVKVALDPTPTQERLLLSHAGASRFAFNAGLAHVKEALDAGEKPEWSYYALVRWWNSSKDTLAVDADGAPWWRENSKEAANTGLEALAAADAYDRGLRKRADGTNIRIDETYKRAPRGTANLMACSR